MAAADTSRYELKYRLTLQEADRVARDLEAHCRPDEHGDDRGRYRVDSLYFDTHDARCYWEKIDGQKIRRKLRYRTYLREGFDPAPGFLEIKKKVSSCIVKTKKSMTQEAALDLAARGGSPSGVDADLPPEFHFFFAEYEVTPAFHVVYDRRALIAERDREVRITFDTGLAVDWPGRGNRLPRYRVSCENEAILELKFNHAIPLWLLAVVRERGLRLERISKYCLGYDRLVAERERTRA